MKLSHTFPLLTSLFASTVIAGQEPGDMKPYPTPDDGVVRTVFRLPALANEVDRKVEVIVGKTLQVDCNHHWFSGDLESRIAEGWGYTYWVLEKAAGPVSTMMACPPDETGSEAFVQVRGEGFLQRYNLSLIHI